MKLFDEMPLLEGRAVRLAEAGMKDHIYMTGLFERPLSEKHTKMMVKAFERKFRDKESLVLGIYDKKTGVLAGVIEAYDAAADGSVQIGYRISPQFRNRGYAKEAVRLFVPWLMTREDVSFLRAYADKENTASQHILTGCGFVKCSETKDEIKFVFGRNNDEK